jgi:hypothetical protein
MTQYRDPLYLILCVVAIVVGVLMYVNAFHVGVGHKGFGVVEITIGALGLFRYGAGPA